MGLGTTNEQRPKAPREDLHTLRMSFREVRDRVSQLAVSNAVPALKTYIDIVCLHSDCELSTEGATQLMRRRACALHRAWARPWSVQCGAGYPGHQAAGELGGG